MSMDLSQYQKVKADEKFSVLRHKNGSEFKIAHEGLSPEIASRIHKMPMFAGGGSTLQKVGEDVFPVVAGANYAASGATGVGNLTPAKGGIFSGNKITDPNSNAIGTSANNPATTVPIQQPYDATDVRNATNSAITSGNGLNTLAGQTNTGGSQNLSHTYDVGTGLQSQISNIGGPATQTSSINQQGGLNSSLNPAGTQGVQNQQTAAAGLGSNISQLQGIANGTGPNPAQAMLNQQTGINVANQAALMASQRGASANPALLARQAAQQGAATQQQAAGQGATLQAQQSLGAIGQMTGANQTLAGVGAGQVGQAQTGITSLGNAGAVATGQSQGQNAQNAGIAQNQVGNQLGSNTAATQAGQSQEQIQDTGVNAQNSNVAGQQGNVNNGAVTLANTALGNRAGLAGGLMNGAGAALGAAAMAGARGGQVHAYEDGGYVPPQGNMVMANVPAGPGAATATAPGTLPPAATTAPTNQPQSSFFNFLKNWTSTDNKGQTTGPISSGPTGSGAQSLNQGATGLGAGLGKLLSARGGKVKGMVSEGEVVVPAKDANNPAAAARDVANAKKNGGEIKATNAGQKATHKGNSYANDKIEKDLPVGGIVIPRSVMQSKDPIRGAAEFVKAVMAKKGAK